MALTQITSEGIKDSEVKNADMADDAVGIDELSATGTAGNTTYLRGDNTWTVPPDTNTQVAIDDTPVNGVTNEAISSNWAYDHNAGTGNSKHVPAAGSSGQFLAHNGAWATPPDTDTNTQLSQEDVEDYVGGMLDGTETGITVTYDDTDGNIDFVVASQTDNNFTTTLKNKLDGIETSADVTDATNVNAAGAVMNSDVDAKGDIFAGTADNTVSRLAVSATNGDVLTVDSSEATGIKWAAAAGGGLSTGHNSNVVGGDNAGDSLANDGVDNGSQNTCIGHNAGTGLTTADNNVAVGYYALASGTAASQNVCIGSEAGQDVTGGNNVCIGFRAGESATSIDSCVGIGKGAYDGANTGDNNIAIGRDAIGNAATTGGGNICIGVDAGKNITGGEYNVAIGHNALDASIEGGSNTAVGAFALGALDANTTGNVAVGMKAGMNLDGDHTTFVGWKCGEDATSGYHNTGVGSQALLNVTTGNSSCAVGYQALKSMDDGHEGVAIGYQAGLDYDANGGVFIGRWAGKGNATTQNTILYIARNADSAGNNGTWIYGNDTGQCFMGANSSSWYTTSDGRLKKDIVDNNVGLSVIDNVKVRNFKYKQYNKSAQVLYTEDDQDVKDGLKEVGEEKSPSVYATPKTSDDTIDVSSFNAGTTADNVVIGQGKTETQIGVIAQELESICPGCVKTDDHGAKTVCTDELFWHMVNAIKELSAKVKALESA